MNIFLLVGLNVPCKSLAPRASGRRRPPAQHVVWLVIALALYRQQL